MKAYTIGDLRAEFHHEATCGRWPHRLLRRVLVNRSSWWNYALRALARKLCPTGGRGSRG